MRRLLVLAMFVLAGCGTGPAAGQGAHGQTANGPKAQGYRLFVERNHDQSLEVVTTLHDAPVTLPAGFLAADGSNLYNSGGQHVYSAASKWMGTTTVNAYEAHTGALARRIEIPGDWSSSAGGTSPDGRWLVFAGLRLAGESSLALLDSSLGGKPHAVSLPGGFDFDALSNDGKRLYLIQNLSGGSYRVRLYDVPSGKLQTEPVIVKGPEVEAMNGYKITAVTDPQGGWVYSLYGRNDGKPPFVHALDLNNAVAYCIDLPAVAGITSYLDSGSAGWSLSLDATRHRLYAASVRGQAAVIDTGRYAVIHSARLAVPAATSVLPRLVVDAAAKEYDSLPASSTLDPSGRSLYVAWDHGFLALDTDTLGVSALRDQAEVLTSLALSPDGGHLFAVSRTRLLLTDLDPKTGLEQATIPSGGQPWRIIRLEAL